MKLSKQVTDQINGMIATELRAAFRDYCARTNGILKRTTGEGFGNLEEVLPLLKQAFDKGIAPDRLAKLVIQSRS